MIAFSQQSAAPLLYHRDSETEQKLLQNIKALNDKTCLIVTHRPAALEIADSILSVESGKIITQ